MPVSLFSTYYYDAGVSLIKAKVTPTAKSATLFLFVGLIDPDPSCF
jgi:hypothetical protein